MKGGLTGEKNTSPILSDIHIPKSCDQPVLLIHLPHRGRQGNAVLSVDFIEFYNRLLSFIADCKTQKHMDVQDICSTNKASFSPLKCLSRYARRLPHPTPVGGLAAARSHRGSDCHWQSFNTAVPLRYPSRRGPWGAGTVRTYRKVNRREVGT